MTTNNNIDNFTRAYIACALWSEQDDSDTPLEQNYEIKNLAPTALDIAKQDCAFFQRKHADLLTKMYTQFIGCGPEQGGHDLWLTRNGHGAGFWDRGLGELGEQLAEAARNFKNTDLYVGDDGLLYFSALAVDNEPIVKTPKP